MLRPQDGFLGTQQGIVEADEHLAGFDPVAVTHADFTHGAAVDVLDHLVAGLDLQLTGGNARAGDAAGLQRLQQRRFVDHRPARDVDEHGG